MFAQLIRKIEQKVENFKSIRMRKRFRHLPFQNDFSFELHNFFCLKDIFFNYNSYIITLCFDHLEN